MSWYFSNDKPIFQQLVDNLVVKFDTLGIHFSHTCGDDPGPGNGKPENILTGFGHIFDICFVIVIEETAVVG